jgi:hypothetical protein
VATSVEPHEVATALQNMFDSGELDHWRKNAFKASQELNWQQEQEVIRKVYGPLR